MYTDKKGNTWYKGNLHTHTTRSDGAAAPEATLKLYREHGYDFIALTDHYVYGEGGLDAESGILVIPGAEYDTGAHPSENVYHIVCAFADREPDIDRSKGKPDVQTIVDEIKKVGGMAILAHPAWSLNDTLHAETIKGLDALEIYNTMSGKPWNTRPYSGLFTDRLASDGIDLGLVASDDVHFYNGDECRSYVLVRTDSPTPEGLKAAMLRGDYLATQGPFMSVTRAENGTIDVEVCSTECEPDGSMARIVDVTFYSDALFSTGRVIEAGAGESLSEAHYRPNYSEHFVRVEATDEYGRTAYSGIIRL